MRDATGLLVGLPAGLRASLTACLLAGPCAAWTSEVRAGETRAAMVVLPPVVTDAELFDATGRTVRFRRDVLGQGVTLVTFTYRGCVTLCPLSDVIAEHVEALLEKAGAGDVRIVTLTLDPSGDPVELRRHAEQIGMSPRRMLLSGDLRETAPLLDGLGAPFGTLENHRLFFLIFDAKGRFVDRVALDKAVPEDIAARLVAISGR